MNTENNRIIEKITSGITQNTNQLFALYNKLPAWQDKQRGLDYDHRKYINATATQKIGWFFFLFILLFIIAGVDVCSISSFLEYLALRAPNFIVKSIIYLLGWLIFIGVELGIGYIVLYSSDKPLLKFAAYLLAILITLLPAVLIYATYAMLDDGGIAILVRTIVLILLSIVLHVVFFLVVREIWEAITYYRYKVKNWFLMSSNPELKMDAATAQLNTLFSDFDCYVLKEHVGDIAPLIDNRAWYLKRKFQGHTSQEYDLSDYDPHVKYAPTSFKK